MPRKPKTAKVETPKLPSQTVAAEWLASMVKAAEEGRIIGFTAVGILTDGNGPITFVMDPGSSNARMMLAGTVGQLHHMIQSTEHNLRMTSAAAQPDITPPR